MVFTQRKIKNKAGGGKREMRSLHLVLCGLGKRSRMLNTGAWRTGRA